LKDSGLKSTEWGGVSKGY